MEQQIRDAIEQSPLSMRQAAIIANMPYRTFIERAKRFGVYKPNQSGKGVKASVADIKSRQIPLSEILDGKHPQYQSNNLKRRLFDEGIKRNECEECGIFEWNGRPIALELDHINGNSHDHQLDNLMVLCPNCHSQTKTFRGRNKANSKVTSFVTDDTFIDTLRETGNIRQALVKLGLKPKGANYRRAEKLLNIINHLTQ